MAATRPTWTSPEGKPLTDLKIYNSLTKSKVPFVARNGREVGWYICGPTVYDASHLGHARNYMSSDYILRIMTDYFGYNVTCVMNITDIDDKIIDRSKENKEEFAALARRWENDFLEDMKVLKVRPPDVLTRVSEFVPEIVQFIEKIIKNGYGYESNGSVYFDVEKFQSAGHFYAKLEPSNVTATPSSGPRVEEKAKVGTEDKRSEKDFALWKRSKEGEPKWNSPWGEGRPGWHIECSAMASDILGERLDFHLGGEDLRFPHHDNELAQSEACHSNHQWVDYFIHAGHLHINGQKMAKSLKNFTTIKAALQKYDARQLRMLFLLHKYEAIMDYSPDSMSEAINVEKLFNSFFFEVNSLIRDADVNAPQKWEEAERKLNQALVEAKSKVHNALSDNFDTPTAIAVLQDLVNKTNSYKSSVKEPRVYLIRTIAAFITRIFKIFGLIEENVGFSSAAKDDSKDPVIQAFVEFRNEVRQSAIAKNTEGVLRACDNIRDNALPTLGFRLTDGKDGTSWSFEDKERLMKEQEQKKQEELKKKLEKEKKEEEQRQKLEKSKIPPQELFTGEKGKYSKFDEKGLPTHDHEGKEISKSASKNLQKAWNAQEKLHKGYLDSLNKK
eukprot:TRINITY_DN3166_c0_g1_i1.p1 TRINITY_DN3166_c0_g1~~TRINITY_DN3166_c0_g1_i1.p1  ORF type:complete len:615 (+),score=267.66 TRINITY_DN3166_c0_g1_i1:63-1907(+)